jgi:hypothetical protein
MHDVCLNHTVYCYIIAGSTRVLQVEILDTRIGELYQYHHPLVRQKRSWCVKNSQALLASFMALKRAFLSCFSTLSQESM